MLENYIMEAENRGRLFIVSGDIGKQAIENKGIAASLSCRCLCKEEQDGWLYTKICGVKKPQEAITCTKKEASDVHVLSASHKQIANSREEANAHGCYLRL